MRIGFDARLWRHTGIGRYIDNLLRHMADENWVIWVAPGDREEAAQAWSRATIRECPSPLFSLREQYFWMRALQQVQLDVFHAPHFNIPLFCPVPLVVTLHDLIPLRFPGTHNNGLGTLYFWWMTRAAVRHASSVIAVSSTTRDDLVALLSADPARITVVHHGVEPRFAEPPQDPAPTIPGRYILYTGQWKRYKNLEMLISAFSKLPPDVKLVLAGRIDPHAIHVPAIIQRLKLEDRVLMTGHVSDAELTALYHHASVFAFPSRYEGFGFPPLEAMAAGVPVVASNAASLPEVVGDAALLLAPDDEAGWVEALRRVLDDEDLRLDLIARGKDHAQRLDWARTSGKTREVYHEVLAREAHRSIIPR